MAVTFYKVGSEGLGQSKCREENRGRIKELLGKDGRVSESE